MKHANVKDQNASYIFRKFDDISYCRYIYHIGRNIAVKMSTHVFMTEENGGKTC